MMRSTYYKTADKIAFRKSIIFLISSYLAILISFAFNMLWEKHAIGILHDDAHHTNILIGILLVVPIFIFVFILNILSLTYAYEYKASAPKHDLRLQYIKIAIYTNYMLIILFILFSFVNVIHLLQLR